MNHAFTIFFTNIYYFENNVNTQFFIMVQIFNTLQQWWKYPAGKNEVVCQLKLQVVMKEICITVNISMHISKWIR